MKRVRVMGEEIAVQAQIKMLDGFSAHADSGQLLSWVEHLTNPKPAKVFVVHGEGAAQEAMKEKLEKDFNLSVYIPFRGDSARLDGRECEIDPSRLPQVSVEKDMEDVLRSFDSEYRLTRRKILQLVIARPELMDSVIRTWEKGWKYVRKLFSSYHV